MPAATDREQVRETLAALAQKVQHRALALRQRTKLGGHASRGGPPGWLSLLRHAGRQHQR